ncbi:(2Fe-2S)-binding protein [Anaerobacillus alkalilacustris]|uniref:(2Fe-2S)-binding protein n=1 Tax=Anaerobacillus alkalilacustris TaxID=393763 RepID=A0A1S2LFN6_9BACI|nr:2Fe-2S iron-sulfur cluster-binding protein [Anaerobacillus alkalilacustris]OIJ11201.1 (2Fe-2S)-binding protein [Anaerobacillus alkalilacustris]
MAKITVIDYHTFDGEDGKKLSNQLVDNKVDILHRCGGKGRCTTCRVEVFEGAFGDISDIEKQSLAKKGLTQKNVRLSCQIRVNGDATINPIMTKSNSHLEPGPRPEE